MESLRWILLGLGAVVVAGIYGYAQITKQRRREPEPSYDQVDWEQGSVQGLSNADGELDDDLPSMDELNSARAIHRAEGNSIDSVPSSFEDTQEIPALEVSAVVEEKIEIETQSAPVNPGLRNNLLLDSLSQEPVLGTPISQVELDAEHPSPSMNADSLVAHDSRRTEPSFTNSVGIDGEQMADALQRRRDPAQVARSAPVKSPVQNTFSFENSTESAVQPSSAERVLAKAQALKLQQQEAAKAAQPLEVQEEVVVLHVKANDSIGFYGPEMAQCFEDIGIKFGEMNIYHYQSGGQRLLSVANMVKPGTFDPDNLTGFTTPGISMFLQLRPASDFELCEQVLVKSAQYIAYKLKGEVLTARHTALDDVEQKALSRDIADIKAAFAG